MLTDFYFHDNYFPANDTQLRIKFSRALQIYNLVLGYNKYYRLYTSFEFLENSKALSLEQKIQIIYGFNPIKN